MAKDVIVVLGGGIHEDGSLPEVAQSRLDKSIELLKEGVAPNIVMTGYKGYWSAYTPTKSEAKAMKDYALSLGVPEGSIVLEERARSTLGNAYFTKKDVLEPRDWKDIVVVTSESHIPRSEYLFRKVLGSAYTLEMVEAHSPITTSELEEIVQGEQHRLSFWKKVLAPMPSGVDFYAALVIKAGHVLRKMSRRRND